MRHFYAKFNENAALLLHSQQRRKQNKKYACKDFFSNFVKSEKFKKLCVIYNAELMENSEKILLLCNFVYYVSFAKKVATVAMTSKYCSKFAVK